MFTQNPKINTCHIFVLLHKSIFLSVAPKIHDLVFHLPRIARHLGTVGGIREDNLESKHAIGNSLRRRLACVRAEEEKLKLMLQLDEVQLRLKSAEFSKPATRRIRKLNNETG